LLTNGEIVLRIALSLLVGVIIGYERSRSQKPAGIRTYSLVCIGSTLFMIVSVYGFPVSNELRNTDPARIAAQVVTGIGFLGAGVIWKDRGYVRGLTTAANLWITAGLGLAIGVGMYFLTLTTVIAVFIALHTTPLLVKLKLLDYREDCERDKKEG
jgi:putative Mg2+ transporter-C (MgtC) family protein